MSSITIQIRTSRNTETLRRKFSQNYTVYDVKRAYCDECDNSKSPEKIHLRYGGKELKPNSATLAEVGIKSRMVILTLSIRVCGGGGPSVPGPNLKSELKQKDWSDSAPAYRRITNGLNIEWVHGGKQVIGQVGYTTDSNKFPKGVFDAARHKYIRMAYCPSENVYCPNSKAIVRYSFCNCKVVFDGELDDGTEVYETKVYGNKYCYYKEGATYSCLTMKVTPN